MKFHRVSRLAGTVTVPGDKSISHRAVMFGSLARGKTEIQGFLPGADCLSTIGCFRAMGIPITQSGDRVTVEGRGLRGLSPAGSTSGVLHLDTGNSGTTTRLISGILAAQNFRTVLSGDDSLNKRPMNRIIRPLRLMGAEIRSGRGDGCPPLIIDGRPLHGIRYTSPVASAQVKSSILLAGLYADGETSVHEPALSRDHSERMLSAFGAELSTRILGDGSAEITIHPAEELHAQQITVPGDISSAAYFLAAGCIVPGSEILIRNVGVNPTRAGILHVLQRMGADLTVENARVSSSEPVADLRVKYGPLRGTEIGGAEIPTLIDEIPVIAAAACFAEGTTVIRDAAELKVKESDRIAVMTEVLSAMGADITPTEDGMVISGHGAAGASSSPLRGAAVDSHKDHRVAMSCAVAAMAASGETDIRDASCVDISYPGFYSDLLKLADH